MNFYALCIKVKGGVNFLRAMRTFASADVVRPSSVEIVK